MAEAKLQAVISARSTAGAAMSKFNKGLIAIGAAVAGAIVAFRGLLRIGRRIIEVSNLQQKADLDLARALATVGENTAEVRQRFRDLANELQDTTTVSNDAIQGIESMLASLGNLTDDGLERATRATLDFAAALGQDATAAAINVAKAAGGYISVLTRYGIAVDQSLSKSEQFNQALELMEQKFGGAAAVAGQTFAGSIARVKNDMDDLLKVFGAALTESAAFKEIFQRQADTLKGLAVFIEENKDQLDFFVIKVAQGFTIVSEASIKAGRAIAVFTTGWADLIALMTGGLGAFQASMEASAKLLAPLQKLDDEIDVFQARLAKMAAEQLAARETTEQLADGFKNQNKDVTEAERLLMQMGEQLKILGVNLDDIGVKQEALVFFRDNVNKLREVLNLTPAQMKLLQDAMADLNEELGKIGASVEGIPPRLQSMNEVMVESITLGEKIGETLERQGARGAARLGTELVKSAITGSKSFGEFFKRLAAGLAEAILQAILLESILAAIGFAKGGKVTAARIVSPAGRQAGGRVVGGISGRDSVLAALTPGEIILPAKLSNDFDAISFLAREIRQSRSQAGPGGAQGISATVNATFETTTSEEFVLDIMERINEAVERGGARLLSSELLS